MKRSGEINTEQLRQFGTVLRQARRGQKLSAREVAKRANISAVYLLALETALNRKTGKPSIPSPAIVGRLAETLNQETGRFLSLAGYSPTVLIQDLMPQEEPNRVTPENQALDDAILALNGMARMRLVETGALISSGQIQDSHNLSQVELGIEASNAYKHAAEEVAQVKERLSQRLAEINQRLRGVENG